MGFVLRIAGKFILAVVIEKAAEHAKPYAQKKLDELIDKLNQPKKPNDPSE